MASASPPQRLMVGDYKNNWWFITTNWLPVKSATYLLATRIYAALVLSAHLRNGALVSTLTPVHAAISNCVGHTYSKSGAPT